MITPLERHENIKKVKTSNETVYFDQFLEVKCSYLCPKDLNDSYMSKSKSDFVVYHNNVRSMNANFDKVHDAFKNCSKDKWPDILAFSDSQTKKDSVKIPKTPIGYHDFEFTPSPAQAGGVGFFVKETLDYDLLPELKLNLDLCEDIWLRMKNVHNTKLNKNGLVIGVIYHRGHDCQDMHQKLCE